MTSEEIIDAISELIWMEIEEFNQIQSDKLAEKIYEMLENMEIIK